MVADVSLEHLGHQTVHGTARRCDKAQHVAAFIDSKPRPAFPYKDRDYRVEKLPPDAVYYNRLQTKLSVSGGL